MHWIIHQYRWKTKLYVKRLKDAASPLPRGVPNAVGMPGTPFYPATENTEYKKQGTKSPSGLTQSPETEER